MIGHCAVGFNKQKSSIASQNITVIIVFLLFTPYDELSLRSSVFAVQNLTATVIFILASYCRVRPAKIFLCSCSSRRTKSRVISRRNVNSCSNHGCYGSPNHGGLNPPPSNGRAGMPTPDNGPLRSPRCGGSAVAPTIADGGGGKSRAIAASPDVVSPE